VIRTFHVGAAALLLIGGLLTGCSTDSGSGVRVEFTAESLASGDGEFPPGTDQAKLVGEATAILAQRLSDSGIADPKAAVHGDTVVITAKSGSPADIEALAVAGVLLLRPVLFTAPVAADASGLDLELRQANVTTPPAEMARRAQQLKCIGVDPMAGNDNPAELLAACGQDGQNVYALGAAIINGNEVASAKASPSQHGGGWVVTVEFGGSAKAQWPTYTAANVGQQVAYVLDSRVVTAPIIQSPISGPTQISTASGFSQADAEHLATMLTTGALPVRFVPKK
jgi:preprotein translocase subunit SecD